MPNSVITRGFTPPPFEREELLRDNILQNVLAGYKDYIYNPNHSEMLFSKGSVMEFENDFKLFTDSDGASADIFLGQLKDGKKVILKGYHVLESSKIAQIVEGALTSQFFANFGLAPKVYGLLSREELLNKKFNFHGHFNPEVHYEIAIIMEYIPDVVNFPKGDLSSILDNEETIFSLEKEIKYFEEFGQRMDRMSLDDRQIFFSKSRKKAYWGDFDAPMIELKEGEEQIHFLIWQILNIQLRIWMEQFRNLQGFMNLLVENQKQQRKKKLRNYFQS